MEKSDEKEADKIVRADDCLAISPTFWAILFGVLCWWYPREIKMQ